MINKTVANYTIKHLIGSGGMADVYYAENRLGKKAAIKVLKSELCAIGTIKERFEQEARIMVDIEHKNIRQAFDLDEINGQPAIIMEYLEGHTLKQLIDKGKISDAKAQKYFEQCVLALRVTHAKEIVHRDIKPSNIFITGDDEVKVLDFGIAKVKESGLGTRTNQMLGTPVYMSPEQIKSPKSVDTKSDVYSLAVTFYHALTGKVPYDSTTDSDYEIHTKIVNEDLDLSKVPSKWATLLNPMLIKAADQRIAIDKIGGNSGSDITQYDPDPPTPKPKPKPKPEVATTLLSIPKWVYYLIGGIALSVAVMLGIRGCGGDSTSEMVVYEVDGLYGYKDATGSIVVSARYEIASAFSGGRAKVSVADSVYYIDASGVMVELIKPTAQPEPPQSDDSEKDESAWQQAIRSNTKSSYEKYQRDFSSGRYVSEARAKIKDIETAEQRKRDEQSAAAAAKAPAKPSIKMISIPGRNFKLSETEITIGQYLAFCKATNSHWPEWLEKGSKYNIYTGSDNYYSIIGMSESNTNHPITGVSALDADAFCKWMGGRLPTSEEWEYAAKGGQNFVFAGSSNLNEVGWFYRNSGGKVQRVKQLKGNGYGLYDMSGNVWEWTSTKSRGPRVYRGGSWFYGADACSVSGRGDNMLGYRSGGIGFRLAASQ